MFAVICLNSKNGVTLEREELEVQSSAKYVVMQGGKNKAGAEVSMLFRKDIWGGIIQSIYVNDCSSYLKTQNGAFDFMRTDRGGASRPLVAIPMQAAVT